jgi:diguanylate cyclase (GGDEF)-like protein/PAS domain S-box-containing protein
MRGKEKTKEQLMDELVKLRQQITELEKSETKHQQIEESLTENEKKYRILVELAADGILIETVEGRILECNTAGAKMFGYTKEKMMNLTLTDLVPEEFAKTLPQVISEKETTRGIFLPRISKKKDGTIFPTEIASKIINIAGKPKLIAYIRDITKRKEAEKKLRKARKMFAGLFNSSPEATLYHDKEGHIININPRFTELFGYTPEEMIGRKIDEGMIYPENKIEEGERLTKNGLTFKGISEYETIRKKKDGTLIPVIISAAPVIVDKKPQGTIALYKDITERKKSEEALRQSQQEFASVFNSSPEALVYVDENANIVNINPRFTELFGYTLEEIKGKNIDSGIIHPSSKLKEGERLTKGSFEGYLNYETIRKKKDGTLFPVSLSVSNITIDGKLTGGVATYVDITGRKKLEEELEKLAHFDNLTGSCNRGYGMGLLEQQIKLTNRKKHPLLLVYIDIDRFKYINDTFGHEEGDKVLKEVVKLFKSNLREIDIICRMGGDEFLLIFPESSLNDAPLIRERLSKNLEKLNQSLNKPYKISFSIGLSYCNPSRPLSIEELIKIADENMYEEKKKKKEGF